MMKLDFEGGRDLEDAMRQLPKATRKAVARRVLKKAAAIFADAMRAGVRVGMGHLRDSIGVGTRLTRRQRAKNRKANPADVQVFVGPAADRGSPAAVPQSITEEFGTHNQAPHPFARPAWFSKRGEALDLIGREMWVEITKATERARRKAERMARGM